jgi:hypothetical protein
MSIKPTHQHDCSKCEFVTATFGSRGLVDWYICRNKVVVGRASSKGSDYFSMDSEILDGAMRRASYVQHLDKAAWSEQLIVAFWVRELWRTCPE